MYPENDDQFEDMTVTSVEGDGEKGYYVGLSSGWSCFVGKEAPVAPTVGMPIRLYGKGIGAPFRGQYLDGQKVFYRTEAEDQEYQEIQSYGADAADWLARWDRGDSVWSIEMGGLGPGYEQAIQITAAEIVRHLLAVGYDKAAWEDKDRWAADRDKISTALHPIVDPLGLSGAQWGAALSLATKLYIDGPRKIMATAEIKDRHIQVSKKLPSLAA